MTIIMPLAGAGLRFKLGGALTPKPLVSIAGRPMIYWAMKNLDPEDTARWVFVAQEEHLRNFPVLKQTILRAKNLVVIKSLPLITPSPLHTIDECRENWQSKAVTVIVNCDQCFLGDFRMCLKAFVSSSANVGVLTVTTNSSHYVHLTVDRSNRVTSVLGKVPHSSPAACGYYFFRSGSLLGELLRSAMARQHAGVELCVTDLLNVAIDRNLPVQSWSLGPPGEVFIPLGDPDLVEIYKTKIENL